MKRTAALLVAILLAVVAIPALTAAETVEVAPVKYVIPGNGPTGYENEMALVNEQLKPLGIELSVQYIPWDVWDQKLNLMLSTGEDFDLFHVMQDRVSFSNYFARGALADITDAIEAEGANITATIPENIMEATKIKGRMYAIPTNWVELGVDGVMTVRQDLLTKYGQPMPTTNGEILDVLEAIIGQWDGAETPYLTFRGAEMNPLQLQTTVLHSSMDRYPFTIKDSMFFVAQDGTIESWVETPEFKEDCEWMADAYNRGLIDPDVLTITQEQISDIIQRGQFVFSFGTSGSYVDMVKEWPEITPEDVVLARIHPEKGTLRNWAFKNGNCVPMSSNNVEGAVRFVNWLYANQENYDLFMYGVEGIHYTATGERQMESIDNGESFDNAWSFADWMIGNMAFIRMSAGAFPSINEARYNVDPNAVNSIAGGFFFDPTEVQAEFSNVLTELASVMAPIASGVQDYETYYPAALERLKAAGLDACVEAYKTQFAAYQEAMG